MIGMFSRNMPLIGLLGANSNVQFKPRKLTWLGSSSSFVNDAYIEICGPRITGYAESAAAVGNALMQEGMAFMTKPFEINGLVAKVRQMLAGF